MKKLLVWTLICALCLSLLGAAAADGTLKVGVRTDIPNFGSISADSGRHYGLEIDIAEAMASLMGYSDIEYVDVGVGDRFSLLESGEVDMLVACVTITEERQELYDFTAGYYTDQSVVMVEDSSCFTGVRDLKGAYIGVVSETNANQLTRVLNSAAVVVGYDDRSESPYLHVTGVTFMVAENYTQLDEWLEDGTVDAICLDGCFSAPYLTEGRSLLPTSLPRQKYGVVTRKGSDLSAKAAEAMDALIADGTIDALTDKWD